MEPITTDMGKFLIRKCKKCGDLRLKEIPDDTIPQNPPWVVDLDAIVDRIDQN